MINVADQLHAAYQGGVLASASEIKDTAKNKFQSEINSDVRTELNKIKKIAKAAL